MSEPVVLLSKDERGVATVTINRPAVNNAYNGDVIQGLTDAFTDCAKDPAVRVVVLRGNGKHFQAGADLKWLNAVGELPPEANVEASRITAGAVCGLNDFPKPTIALVHGGCFGGGVGVVAACDVVIASEDAIFAITEARWGVMAGIIIPHLNAAMGPRNVRRYALTCERFGAAKAAEMGLVHEVCETGKLDETAAPIIEQLLLSAPDSIAQTKQVILEHANITLSDAYFEQLVAQHAAKRQSEEAAEGLKSFAEKRQPAWYPGAA